MDFEREKTARKDLAESIPNRRFAGGCLEILAVCRKIAGKMPEYGIRTAVPLLLRRRGGRGAFPR